VLAQGPISVPREKLVDLVAASAAFQARVDPAEPTDDKARERIHWPALENPDPALWPELRPFAVVMAKGLSFELAAGGGQNYLRPTGTLTVLVVDTDRQPASLKESQIDFENFVGQVMADVAAASAQGENLSITRITQTEPAMVTDLKDRPAAGLFWTAGFEITWGPV